MKYKNLIRGLAIGIVIGVAIFFIYNQVVGEQIVDNQLDKEEAKTKVKEVYDLSNPGVNVEVSTITESSGLYKVIIKGGDQLNEIYMTKDGELLMRNPMKVENLKTRLKNTKDFINCLRDKGVTVYGIANQTATKAQIQVLGGATYVSQIYQSCMGNNVQQCTKDGIKKVPSLKYKETVKSGVQTVSNIENLTGCEFKG